MHNPETERRDLVGRSSYVSCLDLQREHLKDHQAAIKRRIKAHLSDCRICKVGETVQGCDWYQALIGELVTVGQQIRGLK